jgi:hypothetical protein
MAGRGYASATISNGLEAFDPIRALARRYLHIRKYTTADSTLLSAYFEDADTREDLRDKDIRAALKMAAGVLDYPMARGIPVDRIDTRCA